MRIISYLVEVSRGHRLKAPCGSAGVCETKWWRKKVMIRDNRTQNSGRKGHHRVFILTVLVKILGSSYPQQSPRY